MIITYIYFNCILYTFYLYRMIIGGRHGYVTPEANPCKTLRVKTIQRLCLDATGMTNVTIALKRAVLPKTSLVPIFSANVPPSIWNTMYP